MNEPDPLTFSREDRRLLEELWKRMEVPFPTTWESGFDVDRWFLGLEQI